MRGLESRAPRIISMVYASELRGQLLVSLAPTNPKPQSLNHKPTYLLNPSRLEVEAL